MTKAALCLSGILLIAAAGCQESGTEGSTTNTASTKASTSAPSSGSAATNRQPSQAYAEEVTLPNGLKYQDAKVGDGDLAESGMSVTVHYTGWLTNGFKFDSSVDSGRPFTFQLGAGEVIRGWDEGVKGMRVGGKRKLTIPAELGYGSRANGQIPANSTLVFDVELLAVKK